MLRLALPSKGEMEEPTLDLLESCGLAVERPNVRQYTATISGLPRVLALFQRSADIPAKVEEGSADLGITGLDNVMEFRREGADLLILIEDLGYSRCELVVAVPDAWVDVSTLADLVDLSLELREKGRELRIATKYPRLVQQFLLSHGMTYFTMVESSGAMEAAPTMGYADLIADLTSSGTTLRENRLRPLSGGIILPSQACLVGNRRSLRDEENLVATKTILELIEARQRAGGYYSVTANLQGPSDEAVAQHVMAHPQARGLQGPTIAKVYSSQGQDWYAATVVVPQQHLLAVVEHLRQIGGNGITVVPASYLFAEKSLAYERLLKELGQ